MAPKTTTISDLAFDFDDLMGLRTSIKNRPKAKGFVIGKGKKLFWYISPMPRSGLYRCVWIDETNTIVRQRWIEPSQLVTIYYEHEESQP